MAVLLVLYNQTVKKTILAQRPFALTGLAKISSRDWLVTLRNDSSQDFSFEAGQFIWVNTSGSVHPRRLHHGV